MISRIDFTIENFNEKREKKENIESPYYDDETNSYKTSLRIETFSNSQMLNIYLLIWHDDASERLNWPLTRNVCIGIVKNEKSILQYQHIKILKPEINSCRFSNAFGFRYSELLNKNRKLQNLFVRCFW